MNTNYSNENTSWSVPYRTSCKKSVVYINEKPEIKTENCWWKIWTGVFKTRSAKESFE